MSHAVEEKLKTVLEKLSVVAEHRLDLIKVTFLTYFQEIVI